MNQVKRLQLVLESQHEGPSRSDLRSLILRMAASNEDRGEGAERYSREVVMAMINAWTCMLNEHREENGGAPVETVSGSQAEALWWDTTRKAYAESAKRDDPFTDDCLTGWPDWLAYKAEIPKMLLRDMAWIVGHKDGNAFRAMQRYYLAHKGEGRDADTVIHTSIK